MLLLADTFSGCDGTVTGGDYWSCCSSSNPCGLLEGDCDYDHDCSGDLICGSKECDSSFSSYADCCILPYTLSGCDGTGGDFWSCCSYSNPCGLNEGDCDNDYECSGNLICGLNNCDSPFASNADCCILL